MEMEKEKRSKGRYCCVVDCHNNDLRDRHRVRFFNFPKRNPEQSELWVQKIQRVNKDGTPWKPKSWTRICSAHFMSGQYSPTRTDPDYVPSLFPPHHLPEPTAAAVDRHARHRPRREVRLQSEEMLQPETEGDGYENAAADFGGDRDHGDDGAGENDAKAVDYEEALQRAGYGRFHYWLLWLCGWANASDAIEVLCISFLLPSAECDLKLTSADKGWLSAILFLGMLIGGYAWGSLGDSLGRRNILVTALLVNAFSGFASSFSQTKMPFFIFRFLSGIGVGGSIPVVWSYFAEFQPSTKRGGMLSFLATFWMIGNITVAAIAWAIIPNKLGYDTDNDDEFEYNSWRIFVFICGVPSLVIAIALLWLPKSPKFLLSKGREYQAVKILSKIYAMNTGNPPSSYPVTHIIMDDDYVDVGTQQTTVWSTIVEVLTNLKLLFSPRHIKATSLMLYIHFSIQFGYYGLWLWFPELFNKLNVYYKDHDETKSVCQISNLQMDDSAGSGDHFCDTPTPSREVFINSFIISLSSLPSNIWTIVHMDKLGRKFFLVISMVGSGLCAFTIYLVTNETLNLVVSSLFGLVSVMGFNALDCLGIELFPTAIRSTAMAVTLAVARLGAILGNVVFGYFIDFNCAVPILSVAALLISGGLVGLLLPNTTKTPLA